MLDLWWQHFYSIQPGVIKTCFTFTSFGWLRMECSCCCCCYGLIGSSSRLVRWCKNRLMGYRNVHKVDYWVEGHGRVHGECIPRVPSVATPVYAYIIFFSKHYDNFCILMQEVKGNEFILNDSTGVARVITTNVPSGCPTACSGELMCCLKLLEKTVVWLWPHQSCLNFSSGEYRSSINQSINLSR